MNRGLFITFEGADGCGKTTQLNLLEKYLKDKGLDVIVTREPGAKGLGEKFREILLNYEGIVSDRCESFLFLADRAQNIDTIVKPAVSSGKIVLCDRHILFLADRAQNIDTIVKPAVSSGKIVLCDRHIDSSVAYQGYGRGLDIQQIKNLNTIAAGGMLPDLTLVFDIDIETSMQRVGNNKDRMENSGIDFFNRVRNGYLELAKLEPDRIKVVDSTASIDDIHNKVKNIVLALLN